MSRVVDLNDKFREGFYFLGTRNYTAYLRSCFAIIISGKVFISFAQENSTVYFRLCYEIIMSGKLFIFL